MQSTAGQLVLWAVVTCQRLMRGKLGRIRHKKFSKRKQEKNRLEKERKEKNTEQEEIDEFNQWKVYRNLAPKSNDNPLQKKRPVSKGQDKSENMSESYLSPAETVVNEKIKRLEEMEKSIAEKEQRMMELARVATEKADAMERALKLMEERAMQEDADRMARKNLLDLAAGPISNRSPYTSSGPISSTAGLSSSGPMSSKGPMTSNISNKQSGYNLLSSRGKKDPPSARSAKDGSPRPPNSARAVSKGKEWVQLWDPKENAWYWYCDKTGLAQWDHPSGEQGYESSGNVTDYSTDNYESGGYETDAADTGGWAEFWDEQAKAKYWYNHNTGEATWTAPASAAMSTQGSGSVENWVSYIDEATGQEYWYNSVTGETSWS